MRLPDALTQDTSERALALLADYYGAPPGSRQRSGAAFDTWDSTGTRQRDLDRFTADDLVTTGPAPPRSPRPTQQPCTRSPPAEVQALLTRQAQQLDDLEHTVADLRATGNPSAGPAEGQAVPFLYGSLPEFVESGHRPAVRQARDQRRWRVRQLVGARRSPSAPRGNLAGLGNTPTRPQHRDRPVATRHRRPADGPPPGPRPRPVHRLR